jgi:hypothetical protein
MFGISCAICGGKNMNDTKKAGEATLSEKEINLTINNRPIEIGHFESAVIDQTNDAFMILTLMSGPADSKANVNITFGAESLDVEIDAGLSVPQLVIQNFRANRLKITNLSTNVNTSVWVGLYGHGKPYTPLKYDTPIQINQYQSTGGSTVANLMNLHLNSPSKEAAIFYFAKSEPTAVVLNSDGSGVPLGWTHTKDNNWQISKNWGANPLFILNASPGKGLVEVQLINLGK